MIDQPNLTEREWQIVERGQMPAAIWAKLVILRTTHGEPAHVCAECKRYLSLPARMRAHVERGLGS